MADRCSVRYGTCVACHQPFASHYPRATCGNAACHRAWRRQAAVARRRRTAKPKPRCSRCSRELLYARKAEPLCRACDHISHPRRTAAERWCSVRCDRRAKVQRRATRKHGGTGWRWSDFMRIARMFGYCCAYCGERPERVDPDHVVPLSRGGPDSLSNLLPACMMCNSHKRDLLLTEWADDRQRRGLPVRATTWEDEDDRYWHLTAVDMRVAV